MPLSTPNITIMLDDLHFSDRFNLWNTTLLNSTLLFIQADDPKMKITATERVGDTITRLHATGIPNKIFTSGRFVTKC
jgi:hypothetical protein